jgi:hypothetical protein
VAVTSSRTSSESYTMPITVQASTHKQSAENEPSHRAIAAVEKTAVIACEWLYHAISIVGSSVSLSADQKSIWRDCFRAEPTPESRRQAFEVLFQTFSGMSLPHTVELSECAHIRKKSGTLTGKPESIYLPVYHFDAAVPRPAGLSRSYLVERSIWTYIHEASHKFAETEDIRDGGFDCFTDEISTVCYLSQHSAFTYSIIHYRNPQGPRPKDALRNADSYACFVVMLYRLSRGLFKPKVSPVRKAS